LNTYTYDSDGFKKVENMGGSLSTIIWDGTDYLQVRNQTSSTNKTFHTVESQMMSYIENTFRFDLLIEASLHSIQLEQMVSTSTSSL
jgi:hypothetical protein